MHSGDLSNIVPYRLLFVFEHTIGQCHQPRVEAGYLKFHRWRRAVGCWEIAEHTIALLWDCVWRWDCRFDVVTFRPPEFGVALEKRFEYEDIPASNIWATTPQNLGRRLAFMPDVLHIYDGDPTHRLIYGDRGRYVPGGLDVARSLWEK